MPRRWKVGREGFGPPEFARDAGAVFIALRDWEEKCLLEKPAVRLATSSGGQRGKEGPDTCRQTHTIREL